jgi:hypothetical protein
MFLIDLCLIFFDENISYTFKTFDKQFISADILPGNISRDTFGGKEIDIFKIVEKWIHKHRIRYNLKCIEEKLLILLERVRLTIDFCRHWQKTNHTNSYFLFISQMCFIKRISAKQFSAFIINN